VIADVVLVAGLLVAIALIVGWEFFLLRDLATAERVRFLPRGLWAFICLTQIPLGGIAYLLIGHVWPRRHRARVV
jgi:hypothetical protein